MECLPDLSDSETEILKCLKSLKLSTIQQNDGVENKKHVDLPYDLILHILSKLPVKSLCRFKCVCKSWSASSQHRNFIETHLRHSETIMLCKGDGQYKLWDIKDGLVLEECLLTKQYIIRNPTTNETMVIPHPHVLLRQIRISYARSSDSYKLVLVYSKTGTENGGCKVLSLGIDPEWRSLDIPSLQSLPPRDGTEITYSRVVNDVFFLFRYCKRDPNLSELIYIEMDTEHSGQIKNIPQRLLKLGLNNVGFVHWEKQIALSYHHHHTNHELHIWVLEDYKKQRWAEKETVISLSFLRDKPWLEKRLPWYTVNEGWLHYMLEKYYVAFNIESNELLVECAPSENSFSATLKRSIVTLSSSVKKSS